MASNFNTYCFISEPDASLICSICMELASQPKQCEDCGNLFCRECIEKNGRNPCPTCRTVNPKYFKDVRSQREMNNIQVRCANFERGCQWTGTVGTLDDHIASCQFALVSCPNKCEEVEGAGELLIIRKYLDEHLNTKCPKRAYECPHCGEKGTFASITEDHDQVCKTKIVACPYQGSGCSIYMEQGRTIEHVSSDCVYAEVACVYESLGCGVRMLRKDRKKHEKEDREKHLDLSLSTVRFLSQQLKAQSDTVHIHKEHQAITFQLTGYASKKELNERFFSTSFYTHSGGYKMSIRINANGCGHGKGTHVSVFTGLLKGRYDNTLHWPFLGTVTYELLNQLGDYNHHTEVNTFIDSNDMRVGNSKGYLQFLPHYFLGHNPATNTQYLLDDALYFRVSVKVDNHKPWLVCTDCDSNRATESTEIVIFCVAEYSKLKAKNLQSKSNSFYTSFGGYHMCIIVNANGDGDGKYTHVSVFTEILKGRYDNQLHWPFLGTVKVELLNQLGDNNHHNVYITYNASHQMKVGSKKGRFKFLPHSSLDHNPATNTKYLQDDALYFRVSVKMDDHKPWLVCTDS